MNDNMRLHRLKKADDFKVRKWLEQVLDLTDYQKSKIYHEDLIHFSPFEFYEQRHKEKVNLAWRITLPLTVPYLVGVYIFLPVNFLITGKWGYGEKFYTFHSAWMRKLKLD